MQILPSYPPEALGYPIYRQNGKSYWVIPHHSFINTLKEQFLEQGITYQEEQEGLILSSVYALQAYHDFLESLPSSQELVLPPIPSIHPSLHGLPLLVLLSFMIQYGKKPWTFHVDSFGCTQNQAEGANIHAFLVQLGGIPTINTENADVYIINSCAVKKQTEDRMIYLAKQATTKIKTNTVIVSGCLPLINAKRLRQTSPQARLASPNPVPSILYSLVSTEKKQVSRKEIAEAPPIKPVYHDRYHHAAIIPVGQGCLGACTFCAVKFARGRIHSYALEDLISYAKKAIQNNAKELWITGQDTASYGADKGEFNLITLLEELLSLPGNFKIRVGMMNPDTLLPILDDMIHILHHEKMFKFLHLPVQSGSDQVLQLMNRNYTIKKYKAIIHKLRTHHPDLTIATDIIVGFPQETREDNLETMQLIKDMKFDITNISRYMDRPGTKSSRMTGKINSKEMQYRSRLVTDVVNHISLERNKYWLGWKGDVLVGSTGPHGNLIGRNYAYKPVIVSNAEIGDFRSVQIRAVTHTSLLTEPNQYKFHEAQLFASLPM